MRSELIDIYQQRIKESKFEYDPVQVETLRALQRVYDELMQFKRRGLIKRFLGVKPGIQGIYLWGKVGRGKTFLMDLFYDALPFRKKERLNFHRFMQEVHALLRQYKGHKNPLNKVAEYWIKRVWVLCFDEFYVSDIGDAMLLEGLFKGLFERGLVLIATSNIAPDRLYEDGLQRDSFLPAIALLKRKTQVIEITNKEDYRLRTLREAETFHVVSKGDYSMIGGYFSQLTQNMKVSTKPLLIDGRRIKVIGATRDLVWFDFHVIADRPRGVPDYILLAKQYHTILISDVPVLDEKSEDLARRFIEMIDEFYDCRVKVILSMLVPLDKIYQGKRLSFEYQRTLSRLYEMQSLQYINTHHVA